MSLEHSCSSLIHGVQKEFHETVLCQLGYRYRHVLHIWHMQLISIVTHVNSTVRIFSQRCDREMDHMVQQQSPEVLYQIPCMGSQAQHSKMTSLHNNLRQHLKCYKTKKYRRSLFGGSSLFSHCAMCYMTIMHDLTTQIRG